MTGILILAGVIFVGGAILKSPWFKGWFGEFQVNLAAKLLLDKNTYHLIKNVTVPTDNGTTQIDHIIVSRFGIFVVETKNVSGWIFGKEGDAQWTQKLHGNHSQKFQNPLRQNYKHTKTLADILQLPHEQFKSVIVFVGNTTFKADMPENVTLTGGYIRFIKSQKDEIFTDNQVEEILNTIAEKRLAPGLKTHREHVRHVHEIVDSKNAPNSAIPAPGPSAPKTEPIPNESPSCPKCGLAMALRTTKRGKNAGGQFWGCSQYPQCRGIVKMA